MNKITSKNIVKEVVNKIFSGELLPNQKLPSENQISIKYGVSRMMATKAYVRLKTIGAIYSIPKKGFFVAEHFSGIIRSIDEKYKIEKIEDFLNENKIELPIINKNKIEINNLKIFKRNHFIKDELIIKSINWYDSNYIDYIFNKDFISNEIKNNKLESSITFLKFEKIIAFEQSYNLVLTTVYYGGKIVPYIQKAIINPKYFKMMKTELSI